MDDGRTMALQTGKPLTLIPVGLKEAALDSPTFRSGFTHFSEQLDLVERWLENYVRAISKLSHEITGFEAVINGFLAQSVTPSQISEAVLDHDYTLLAMKRYGEGAKQFWTATITGLKKMDANMVEPIRRFLHVELRAFKETRRAVEQTQKHLDNLLSRYASQSRNKEASSLREDAFQVHEARKAYLKASMDFSVLAPEVRISLDKMLVRIFSDQWRDTRNTRQLGALEKWTGDIERVRGWSREMENGERTFRKELQTARKQIEDSAEAAVRPSRELDDYSMDAMSKSRGPSNANLQANSTKSRSAKAEKQGWLNLRTVTGKPSRTVWLRRWFYVKNGIFGWLVQGSKSGAVEESERIGVLLCNVRPSNLDDRRYVFEIKTKDSTIVAQAETLPELNDWLMAFEVAKQRALEDPRGTEAPGLGPRPQDPAFAISPPSAPEFTASAADSGMPLLGDEALASPTVDRSSTLPVPGTEALARSSFDVNSPRKANFESEGGTREKIISKLDLHRKPLGSGPGGIASLIAASHGSMPVGPGVAPATTPDNPIARRIFANLPSLREVPATTLAPSTLANPPAPTNLSATAVVVNGERGMDSIRTDGAGGTPSGLLANVWGSSNWGYLNRLERGELRTPGLQNRPSDPQSQSNHGLGVTELSTLGNLGTALNPSPGTSPGHRKTVSLDRDINIPLTTPAATSEYPPEYPIQLRTQDAQFHLLFPDATRDEQAALVFKASWNPNEQQDFPGRVYVTPRNIYFYSNHCGMTMTTSIRLDLILDVTAASGRECDFLYLHLKNESPSGSARITIKTFLEPLRLLQRRLNFLVHNASNNVDDQAKSLQEIIKSLIRMEQQQDEHAEGSSPDLSGWENVSIHTPVDGDKSNRRRITGRDPRDLRANVLIDRGLYGDSRNFDGSADAKSTNRSFKLPKQPVIFVPAGIDRLAVEKEYSISPKALFHVLFGDKSAVWQLLYHERHAHRIRMGPWKQPESGHLRREFEYEIEYLNLFRQVCKAQVSDYQVVDSANEHLLYVISDRKTPWHLPYRDDFTLLTKVVITHVAKSKCKMSLYTKVDWNKSHFAGDLVKRRALYDLHQDALDLADVVSDQCRRLGENSRTKKAMTVFGPVGVQNQVLEFAGTESPLAAPLRRSTKPHTLTSLFIESCLSLAESILTWSFQLLFRLCRWTWDTVSANGIILCILAFSILANMVLSSRNATDSWRERQAAKFMARLGIGPELTMTKSIYLHDLHDATNRGNIVEIGSEGTESKCRDTFDDMMQLSNPYNASVQNPTDSPYMSLPGSSASSQIQQRRIQRTRENLGSQRHDLVVAMRVINSIEREMQRAEWETWLMNESVRCEQIRGWLQRHRLSQTTGNREAEAAKAAKAGQGNSRQSKNEQIPLEDSGKRWNVDPEKLDQIEAWYGDYCSSCLQDRAGLDA